MWAPVTAGAPCRGGTFPMSCGQAIEHASDGCSGHPCLRLNPSRKRCRCLADRGPDQRVPASRRNSMCRAAKRRFDNALAFGKQYTMYIHHGISRPAWRSHGKNAATASASFPKSCRFRTCPPAGGCSRSRCGAPPSAPSSSTTCRRLPKPMLEQVGPNDPFVLNMLRRPRCEPSSPRRRRVHRAPAFAESNRNETVPSSGGAENDLVAVGKIGARFPVRQR
jgi:hypothetical protein